MVTACSSYGDADGASFVNLSAVAQWCTCGLRSGIGSLFFADEFNSSSALASSVPNFQCDPPTVLVAAERGSPQLAQLLLLLFLLFRPRSKERLRSQLQLLHSQRPLAFDLRDDFVLSAGARE